MSGMGGLALIVRAEKLQTIMILALIIEKFLRYQAFKKKSEASKLDSYNPTSNISCCGKILRAYFTKVNSESINWPRKKNLEMVIISGIG